MAEFYKGVIPILDDNTPADRDILNPRNAAKGYVPRDYSLYPEEMFAPPSGMAIIPESEQDARYDEEEATQSSLEHLYLQGGVSGEPAFVNLDQNGHGYCWAYSTGHGLMFDRLIQNEPMIRLNPHATAAIIKRGRDEGGWCGLSAKWAEENGYAIEGTGQGQWPLHSRNLQYDTLALRSAMALHKTGQSYVDLTRQVYDRNLTRAQFRTCLQSRIPCPSDWNPWSHSVLAIRWVRVESGRFLPLIINSWKGWGRHGLAVIQYNGGTPDGAVSLISSTPSMS